MSDTAKTTKEGRRLWIIVAVVVAVLAIALVGAYLVTSSAADGKASAYDDDFATWRSKDRAVLLAATARVPKGTYALKDSLTASSLAKQKAGCDAVEASRKKLAGAADRLPTLGDNGLLDRISPKRRDAADLSARREKSVIAYAQAADKALEQLQHDCRWNIAFNSSAVKPNKLYDKSKKYLLQPGEREPNQIFCPGPQTCISSITKKKNAYADLRLEAVALRRSEALPLLSDAKCRRTSYGPACAILRKSWKTQLEVQHDAYDFIRTTKTSTNNDRIDVEFDKIDKAGGRYAKQIKKAVLALDPELRKDKDVRKYPTWNDKFFSVADKLLLADLADERASLDKL